VAVGVLSVIFERVIISSLQPLHSITMRWLFLLWVSLMHLTVQAAPVAMAVLGDSDTHGYHDSVAFADVASRRGGPYYASTHQWTEILAMLRPEHIDLGLPTLTGTSGRLARLLETLGFDARSPKRFDHLHNFAYSGNGCEDLFEGTRQVPRLIRLMQKDPQRWQRGGVVVIRIGVKNFGLKTSLARLAQQPNDPQVQGQINTCIQKITQAAQAIRANNPQTAIVLVGIFNNAHLAYGHERWNTNQQLQNIEQALDRFDHALQAVVRGDKRMAFFDDRAWFSSLWGTRDASGQPAYRKLVLSSTLQVTNSLGDAPEHAVIADGHAGTAFNAKWAQAMVTLLNQRFDLRMPPITDEEVLHVVAPSGQWPQP
jgi:hypothetical protein